MSKFIEPGKLTIDPGECIKCKHQIHRWVIQEKIIYKHYSVVVIYVCYDCGQQKAERV